MDDLKERNQTNNGDEKRRENIDEEAHEC